MPLLLTWFSILYQGSSIRTLGLHIRSSLRIVNHISQRRKSFDQFLSKWMQKNNYQWAEENSQLYQGWTAKSAKIYSILNTRINCEQVNFDPAVSPHHQIVQPVIHNRRIIHPTSGRAAEVGNMSKEHQINLIAITNQNSFLRLMTVISGESKNNEKNFKRSLGIVNSKISAGIL